MKTLASTAAKPKPNIQNKIIVAVHQDNYTSKDIVIKNGAIIALAQIPNPTSNIRPSRKAVGIPSGRHSTRAEKQISPELLRQYLGGKGSPLAGYTESLLQSPYWSTIIGICTIEQYGCTRAPGNNYWGIMCGKGKLCAYSSIPDGISAINALLTKYEANGHDTIESLNGYYVVPASSNWYNTVLSTKLKLESL